MSKVRARRASLTLLDIAAGIAVTAAAIAPAAAASPSPIYTWTGVYVGGHAGYRWADANFDAAGYTFNPGTGNVIVPPRSENYGLNGGIVGGQVGYNFLVMPNWLLGAEADLSWGNGSDSASQTITGVDASNDAFTLRRNSEVKLTWQSTIRARLGYVAGPWLVYGTGGVAFVHVKWSDNDTLVTFPPVTTTTAAWSSNTTLTGWTAGGGVEYMFAPHWTVRGEYLYESVNGFTVSQGFGTTHTGNLDLSNVQKVRFGINYIFSP